MAAFARLPAAAGSSLRPAALALAVSASAALGPALAQGLLEYPRRAFGLWEVRSVGAQAAGLPPVRQCVGEGTDNAEHHMDRQSGRRGACEFGPFRRAGLAWTAESECRQGATRITSRSVLTGDLASAYRIDTLVRYDPPLAGTKSEDREALEARRLGPCLAGQSAGDVVVPGVGTLNMGDGAPRRSP
ncbi:hypothetical protein M6I34_01055 [Burkholderiaceae bacterium FT117]|uniref:DUF3617 domain-containing protein n=1 Tax=Zeimonas sediminis TaxID=2944268 RepID=UPI002342DCE1|nr:DUF3617 family protein [Zeimonas sediminis]MCM5569088.1 hypothetical protein [Zeimonas sediminis]